MNISSVSTDLSSSWYYVSGNVTFSKRLNVTGSTVHLILCDGATLHAELGIHVGPGKTFIVHGQANDSGKIQIDDCDKYEAGIGSNDYDDDGETTAGTMIFQGGQIGSRGGNDGAGIGGGNESAGGVVEIYGGSVYASSATDGAGIGGGDNGSGGNVTIYGGHVQAYGGGYGAGIGGGDKDTSTARGGVTYIYGGTVEAYGGTDAAGIGGGEGSDARYTEIYGGTVTATGGKYGAGIGGGQDGDGGYIYIRGGTVTAKGGVDAAGIGGGETGHGGNIYISGGSVTATGNEYGAGIGGGEDCDGGTIYISGGEVTATGGTSNSFGNVGGGAGIGGGCDGTGGTITITGGKITATGGLQAAGIGGGYIGRSGTIVINGGEIKAVGECGAGIGNGALNCIDVNITINGGTIDAWGGDKLDSGGYPAAAIGVGATKGSNQTDVCEFSGTIRLNGGNITTHSYLCSREIIMSEELDYERVKAVVGSAVGGNSFYLEQLEGDIYIGGGVTLNTNAVNTISGGVRVIGDRESYVSAEDELSTPIGSKNIHFIDGDKIGSMVRYDDTIVAKNKRVSEARSYHKNLIIEPCEHSFIDGYVNITSDTHDRVCEYCEATFVEEHTFNTVWTEDESGKKNRVSTCELCGYEAETTVDEYVAAVEPYIDEDGAYILGDVEHYVIDGKNYAVNADGSVGDELEEINTLSYFEFSGEYQLTITHYTGPTDITELVIPKTYNGKNITALGSGNTNDQFLSNGTDAPFDLVLTENIRTINAYAFWASKVKEVKGDTSLLSKINAYAFSWANPDNDFKVVFNLDRDVSYAATAFSNLNAVVNMKHEYKLTNNSVTNPNYQSLTYNFTDEHEFAENKWEWSDHYNKATLTFSACSKNELCEATETIDATVTYEDKDGKRIYTATAEYNGETYTDTVEAGEYFVAVEPYVDEDGTYVFGVKEHYEMGGKNYVVNEDGSIGEELDSIVLSYFNMEEGYDGAYTDEKLKGTLTMTGYTGPTDNLTELVIPKVYDGKKVTAISGFSDKILQQPFTVVLNENITMLGFAFKNQPVTAVTGNTTSLRIITSDTFTIEDTEEKIPLTINWFKETDDSTWIFSDAFTNRLVTFRLKHSFKGFGDLATLPSDAIYDFIDEHTFTENEWTWSDDFTTAKVTLSNCTGNALCTETETIDAAVTREVKDGKCVMTATAEYNGVTYTDQKTADYVAQVEPSVDDEGAYILGTVAHYVMDGKNYGVKEDGTIDTEIDSLEISYFTFSGDSSLSIAEYTGPVENLTELVIPATYEGKPITTIGSDNNGCILKTTVPQPFTLVMGGNVQTIWTRAFKNQPVTAITGDTSSIYMIVKEAFSCDAYDDPVPLEITRLECESYPDLWIASDVFENRQLTFHFKHANGILGDDTRFLPADTVYDFVDEHTVEVKQWNWTPDCTGATVDLKCTGNALCPFAETLTATVTYADADGVRTYTATAEYDGVTYTDTKDMGIIVERTEPYMDEDLNYFTGHIRHYEFEGKNYAINEDGSMGDELESVDLSYFEFNLLDDDTYQINYYTGPTDDLTELVIPKTYDGKKVTVLGNDDSSETWDSILITHSFDSQFTLVLNENITEIKPYTFWALPVNKVTGDTSNLSKMGFYAFGYVNQNDNGKLDITTTYEGILENKDAVYIGDDVTIHLKHATDYANLHFYASNIVYDFLDEHTFEDSEWTWADDFSSATVTLSNCTGNDLCEATETVEAEITYKDENGKRVYTATAEYNGTEYTDTKEGEIPIVPVYDQYNLTVEENIDTNIVIDVNGHKANDEEIGKIVYTYPDITSQEKKTVSETVNADEITLDANGYFTKSITMAVAQANEPIKATLYFTNGTTKDITVSVAAYCEYIIANAEANNYPAKLVNLCYAVLDYGKNAADYFNYSYDAYPEYTLPSYFDAEPEIASQAGIKKGDVVTGIASTQMFILSKATMRLTFKDDLSAVEVVSAKIGEKALAAAKVDNNGKDAVDISGIYATDLNKPILLELSDGTKVQYAATDWANSILTYSTNAKSKALAKSLYYYSKAANDYFA